MATEQLLTLALSCPSPATGPTAATGAGCDGQAADDWVAELVADLNEIEGVLAEAGQGEPQPGSKAIGSLLLGQLSAQLNDKNALKVLGYLKRRLLDQPQPLPPQAVQTPLRLKLSHTKASGEAVALELEAPASDQAALLAMFDRAEAFVARQP
ncbi:MAG: hypothetical protein ACK550_11650 [Synechococcaceae cyanobacterium]|jgi:hypothetical protein